MTIKKPMKVQKPAAEPTEAAPAGGSAVLADRFKLDIQDPNAKRGSSAAATAVVALIALAVAGILTFVIYQHWEALKGA